MIINGTLRDIVIKRVRNFIRDPVELKCTSYRLDGEFPLYNRLDDYIWKTIATKIVPIIAKDMPSESKQDNFIMNTAMLPASLIVWDKKGSDDFRYYLTCMDQGLTTTYSVWFTMDDEIFRRSQLKLKINNIRVEIQDKNNIRELHPKGITETEFGAHWSLAQSLWFTLNNCIMLEFENKEEEFDSIDYLTPDWVNKNLVCVKVTSIQDHCHWECYLPDGSYHAKATFDISEVPAT